MPHMICFPVEDGKKRRGGISMKKLREILEAADVNKNGHISLKELEGVMRSLGLKFPSWKAWLAMRHADTNGNGFLDQGSTEIKLFADLLQERWGIVIWDN